MAGLAVVPSDPAEAATPAGVCSLVTSALAPPLPRAILVLAAEASWEVC